ncbi:MAG: hypothetical protein PHT79_01035 [Syntrophomonadaceae bacterium]|nr:hypothetical protein [Syntrophomonadaceae bacterium]MDD4548334.1 hypothetical protein [Syntrophomonadaceae bacterium]
MVETPCEGAAAEGGERHGRRERAVEHGRESARYPWSRKTSRWCFPCGDWSRNICAFKLTPDNYAW